MRDGSVTLTWGDGDYVFRLGWGEIAELQEKCDAGPYVVLGRLNSGEWRVRDISEVIRLGLIGGGMEPVPALKLVRHYVESRPPIKNHLVATLILTAGIMGSPEEKLGEDGAAGPMRQSTASQTEKFDLPPSTEPEPFLDSHPKTSTE